MTGVSLIGQERLRHQKEEGYTVQVDLERYTTSEPLTSAAIVYAMTLDQRIKAGDPVKGPCPWPWPWDRDTFKPLPNRVAELAKAGALIAAAIDYELAKEQS